MRLLFIVLFALSFVSCNNEKALVYDLVICCTEIYNVEKGIFETGTVCINKDTIARISLRNEEYEFGYKQLIDGDGKYLLPGFWDNHVHFRGGNELIKQNEAFLKQYIKYGITTVRDAGGDLTPLIQQWNQEIQNNQRVGPTIYTSGPKLDGPNARWEGSIPVANDKDISTALDSLQSLNVDYVKLYDSTLSRKHYLDIIAEAQERSMITSGHMPFTVELNEAINAGLDNVEHLYYILKGCSSKEKEITQQIIAGELGFWDSMSQLITTYDEDTAQATFKRLKDQNVFVTPTLHIGDILSYLDELDHTNDRYLSHLSDTFIKTFEGRNKRALTATNKAKQDRKDLQKFFVKLTASLYKADVGLLAGSDCGAYNSYVYPGPSLHKELQQMVQAGLAPQEALQTSFGNGPRFLQKDMYGLKSGATADLVLLEKNPLEDIKNTMSIQLTIKNGKIYKLKSL